MNWHQKDVWFQINRCMVNKIWFWYYLIKFRKDFSVCKWKCTLRLSDNIRNEARNMNQIINHNSDCQEITLSCISHILEIQFLLCYIQFLFKRIFEFNKKGIISIEKMINSGNYTCIIMLTRSSGRIFNLSHYTGHRYIQVKNIDHNYECQVTLSCISHIY